MQEAISARFEHGMERIMYEVIITLSGRESGHCNTKVGRSPSQMSTCPGRTKSRHVVAMNK